MTDIHARDLAIYKGGQRRLAVITQPGTYPVQRKSGEVDIPFEPGEIVLADQTGHVIVGPLNFAGALSIAVSVLDADPRAVTESHSLLALASWVACLGLQPPQESEPATRRRAG